MKNRTVKIMVEVETTWDATEIANTIKETMNRYMPVAAAVPYSAEQAERAAFLVLDDAFISEDHEPNRYHLQGGWDKLHKDLVRAMDPIESAKALQRAKEILS